MSQLTGKRKSALMLCVAAVVTCSLYVAGQFAAGPALSRGQLPDFELETVSNAGQAVTAASLSRRPALLNVWASWCQACRTEHPLLMRLADSGRIAIYGVNYLDERDDAIRWLNYFGDPYHLSVYDNDGKLGEALGVDVVPGTYVIGIDGQVLYGHVGPLNPQVLEEEIWPRVEAIKAERQ